jgi:hypothetical protein
MSNLQYIARKKGRGRNTNLGIEGVAKHRGAMKQGVKRYLGKGVVKHEASYFRNAPILGLYISIFLLRTKVCKLMEVQACKPWVPNAS